MFNLNNTLMQQFRRNMNFLKIHKRAFMVLGLWILTFIVVPQVSAEGGIKISSLSEVTAKAKEGSDTITDIAKYVLGAVLAISLVFVIYALATNNPHGKEYLLGWIIAVIVIMVGYLII